MDKFLKRSEPSTSRDEQIPSKKHRKYSESYLKYGFSVLDDKPQCVVCCEVLSAESMKPSKLIRHLETKHPSLKNKPVEFFQRKLKELDDQKTSISKVTQVSKSMIEASYQVSLRIAKKCKPHTIAENLLVPAAMDMVRAVIGTEEAKKLKSIPLSDNTVARRIDDMADDIREQLIQNIKDSDFIAIQFDESTDVSNLAQFSCFVRYITDGFIKENMLFCKPLPGHTTGECLFDLFVDTTTSYNIDWKKCIAICSDGAKALTGHKSGLIVKLKSIMPNAEWTHCFGRTCSCFLKIAYGATNATEPSSKNC